MHKLTTQGFCVWGAMHRLLCMGCHTQASVGGVVTCRLLWYGGAMHRLLLRGCHVQASVRWGHYTQAYVGGAPCTGFCARALHLGFYNALANSRKSSSLPLVLPGILL